MDKLGDTETAKTSESGSIMTSVAVMANALNDMLIGGEEGKAKNAIADSAFDKKTEGGDASNADPKNPDSTTDRKDEAEKKAADECAGNSVVLGQTSDVKSDNAEVAASPDLAPTASDKKPRKHEADVDAIMVTLGTTSWLLEVTDDKKKKKKGDDPASSDKKPRKTAFMGLVNIKDKWLVPITRKDERKEAQREDNQPYRFAIFDARGRLACQTTYFDETGHSFTFPRDISEKDVEYFR
jgi:hypothetical protein